MSRGKRAMIQAVLRRLAPLYGPCKPPRSFDPVAELVYTILSQHTSDKNSIPAYEKLIRNFGSWEAIANAPTQRVAEAIRNGGLAQIKAPRIQSILREIKAQRGDYNLDFLKELALDKAKEWLLGLHGVGPKTAACVLLFSLGLPALPVDTHVYRVARRLRLFGTTVSPDQSHEALERQLRPDEVLPFHMYLITHGRQVCRAQRPLCEVCVLEHICPSSLLKKRRPVRAQRDLDRKAA
jgi:endonuclease-3